MAEKREVFPLEKLAQVITMKIFLKRIKANGYGNATEQQKEIFDLIIDQFVSLNGDKEDIFGLLCDLYRNLITRIQRCTQIKHPQLNYSNKFIFSTLP
ncbi:unnamed protein product [Caenorhabditis angaria]|uniref:Uncharacterized protein n=1 Tax=Caenorhabditis angaria TaxID=860376 RepID=A0A9P1I5U4_9PELO|nr:unnamed protein product [Caenorhabditis angaria]